MATGSRCRRSLSGGTGGARAGHGLRPAGPASRASLTVIVNVADDFEHWGLHISPDIDSVLYTLAGLIDPERGWGVANDTSTAMAMAERLGAETWFHLGDADLATNLRRTAAAGRGRQPDRCHRRHGVGPGDHRNRAAGDR